MNNNYNYIKVSNSAVAFIIPLIACLLFLSNRIVANEKNTNITSTPAIYYVAVDGDDNNPGTIEKPFASWQKGIDVAQAGDTIFIRGGQYNADPEINDRFGAHISKSGSKDSMICMFAYPGETPLLDASTLTNTSRMNCGVYIDDADYWHIKGLQVTGVSQQDRPYWVAGILIENSNYNIVEQCVSFTNEGIGIQIRESSEGNLLLNCDAYDNYDPENNGNNADGFQVCFITYREGNPRENILRGCRSWKNSDDGYDLWDNEGRVVFDKCWAFLNGTHMGDGYGFKLGRTNEPREEGIYRRVLTNCIAAENIKWNFNNSESDALAKIYNCTAYRSKNFSGFDMTQDNHIMGGEIKNSISYNNRGSDTFGDDIKQEYNDWNLPEITVTDDDFVSLDISLLNTERQPDGSLPDVDYLKPKVGSDLIDSGIDVGLNYYGEAPDLGAIEYNPTTSANNLNIEEENFKVYPNPSNNKKINIEIGKTEICEKVAIDVFDMTGKTVYQRYINTPLILNQKLISIDLSELNSGIYFLRYRNKLINHSCKLIMNN